MYLSQRRSLDAVSKKRRLDLASDCYPRRDVIFFHAIKRRRRRPCSTSIFQTEETRSTRCSTCSPCTAQHRCSKRFLVSSGRGRSSTTKRPSTFNSRSKLKKQQTGPDKTNQSAVTFLAIAPSLISITK